jgi:hypothetical protein
MRTIVEGVREWKETYEDFYKFKGNHNKTPEQREIVNKKKNIYDNVYQYWRKIGKAVYKDDFPEKLKQSGGNASLSSPEPSVPSNPSTGNILASPRSDMQTTPREGDHLFARSVERDNYEMDSYYHSANAQVDLDSSTGEVTGEIKNYYERLPPELQDNYQSPSFHLHRLKVPFRMLVVAPSGTGLFAIT